MKTELTDVSETRKTLSVEIPTEEVDAQIARVTRTLGRSARLPGFRPGKIPPQVMRRRFGDRILQEVARDLIPKAVDEALRERGLEPVGTPDIKDVTIDEGRPLTFTAAFDTLPPVDPGDLSTVTVRRPPVVVTDEQVEAALARLQEHHARSEPVEGRGAQTGDLLTADLDRRRLDPPEGGNAEDERHQDARIEIGAAGNPPGFDEPLLGAEAGADRTFTVRYPPDHAVTELAGAQVEYRVRVKAVHRKVVPALDDDFARDVGDFDSLAALRERIREDLTREAEADRERDVRTDLLRQLGRRVTFELPTVLVEREVDRRVEEFVRQLIDQRIDPRQTNINWEDFRQRQYEPARDTVRSVIVLDAIARREALGVSDEEVEQEIQQYAARSGSTPEALRRHLERDGGLAQLVGGLRREKAVARALERATIISA